ncbi:hypothetical protein TSMEX_008962 [Taenia solium]|eukprot:TsM_000487500 transcript=TsM_000487500 gene=TsM_000487500
MARDSLHFSGSLRVKDSPVAKLKQTKLVRGYSFVKEQVTDSRTLKAIIQITILES